MTDHLSDRGANLNSLNGNTMQRRDVGGVSPQRKRIATRSSQHAARPGLTPRRPRHWITAVAIVATLTGASTAHAQPTRLQHAEAIADSYYPASPCHGRAVVIPVPESRFTDYWHDGGEAGMLSTVGDCRVEVVWARWANFPWRAVCRALVHEYGHLAGLQHSTDRASVMYPGVFDIAQGSLRCWQAFRDPTDLYSPGELRHAHAVAFLRRHPRWRRPR